MDFKRFCKEESINRERIADSPFALEIMAQSQDVVDTKTEPRLVQLRTDRTVGDFMEYCEPGCRPRGSRSLDLDD
jgi:hypothetical protein